MSKSDAFKLLLAAMAFCLTLAGAPAGEVPPLSELRKPVPEKSAEEKAEEKPATPRPLSTGEALADPSLLAPPDAAWYFAANDVKSAFQAWDASPFARFLAEPRMRRSAADNNFDIVDLFQDLPKAFVTVEKVEAISEMLNLSRQASKLALKAGFAGYPNQAGGFDYLVLLDVGLDRLPAFDEIAVWEMGLFRGTSDINIIRGDHSHNFLDVWEFVDADGKAMAEVAAGFANNYLVASNNRALAQKALALIGGGEALSGAPIYTGMAQAMTANAAGDSDIVGLIRMRAVVDGLAYDRTAGDTLAGWIDVLGQGTRSHDAVYYGLKFQPDKNREVLLSPVTAVGSLPRNPTLPDVLARTAPKSGAWLIPQVIPSQPAPVAYFTVSQPPAAQGRMISQDSRLFGSSSMTEFLQLPKAAREVFTERVQNELAGEGALALFPTNESDPPQWLAVFSTGSDLTPILPKSEMSIDIAGVTIHSAGTDWRNSLCWTSISSITFRRLQGHFLVFASSGNLLSSTLEQVLAGTTFAANKDFIAAAESAGDGLGMMCYVNLPEILVRLYPNLSVVTRSIFPRSSGFNSRPPLNLLRRYAKGVLITAAPPASASGFLKFNVEAPAPSLGITAGLTVATLPHNLRVAGRQAMAKSRDNLQQLWLKLQLYSSRSGYFPPSLEELREALKLSMTNDDIKSLFIAPAAIGRVGAERAATESYTYVSGVLPGDEPDMPIIYEALPWNEDFSGMHPKIEGEAPSESGVFQPYRQYVRLDGKVATVSEKTFREYILPRITERE